MTRALILLTLMIALHGAPVAAQVECGPYTSMTMQLQTKYSESLRSRGTSGQAGMELWVNEKTGSWSILRRYSNGMACLRAAGKNFEMFEAEIPGEPT